MIAIYPKYCNFFSISSICKKVMKIKRLTNKIFDLLDIKTYSPWIKNISFMSVEND